MTDTLPADERSQPLLRVPRDKTPGELILDDGERSYAMFFVPRGDTLSRVFEDDRAFMPVAIGAMVRVVARARVACMTAHVAYAHVPDEAFPQERQRVIIRLKGGSVVRGELRWIAPAGHRRTLDHLNDASHHVVVHDDDYIHFIAKAAIVSVEEY